MKVYKANRKGYIHYLLLGMLLLPIAVFLLDDSAFSDKPFGILPLLGPFALILWFYFGTYYAIDKDKLKYKSAFLRGEIDILRIREVIVGKTMWVGIKPALATNGLIIKYNKYDEIYLAPESNEALMADLLKINAGIEVKDGRQAPTRSMHP